MCKLQHAITNGCDDTTRQDPVISTIWQHRESLFTHDGVILYEDRVVIPQSLRPTVLDILHSAHRGTSAMEMRARATVFWPGMIADIQKTSC